MPIRERSRTPKRGTILVVALVMLTFLLLLSAGLARAVMLIHQSGQRDERRQQAVLLAESGVQRGRQAVHAAAEYQGETWQVPAEVLGNGAAAEVVIRVDAPTESSMKRRIVVEANYPATGTERFQFRRETEITPRGADTAD